MLTREGIIAILESEGWAEIIAAITDIGHNREDDIILCSLFDMLFKYMAFTQVNGA